MSSKQVTKKTTTKKASKTINANLDVPVVEVPVVEVPVVDVPIVEVPVVEVPVVKRVRKQVNKETVLQDISSMNESIELEIQKLRENDEKGIKFLRTLNKRLKKHSQNITNIVKIKPKSTKERVVNTGFTAPVIVSPELCKFAEWNTSEHHSRIDATKKINAYIIKNNLQDPTCRRVILWENDKYLSKLFRYTPKMVEVPDTTQPKVKDENGKLKYQAKIGVDGKPIMELSRLSYFQLQTVIKHHFTRPETPEKKAKA